MLLEGIPFLVVHLAEEISLDSLAFYGAIMIHPNTCRLVILSCDPFLPDRPPPSSSVSRKRSGTATVRGKPAPSRSCCPLETSGTSSASGCSSRYKAVKISRFLSESSRSTARTSSWLSRVISLAVGAGVRVGQRRRIPFEQGVAGVGPAILLRHVVTDRVDVGPDPPGVLYGLPPDRLHAPAETSPGVCPQWLPARICGSAA